MSKLFNSTHLVIFPLLSFVYQLGCATAPPPAVVAPYEPNFKYNAPESAEKTDITLGIVRPQFKGTGRSDYFEKYKDDQTLKAMLRSMDASISEILVAKGFKTTGPFDSVNEMTFPEKKTADLLFYPEFNYTVEVRTVNPHPAAAKESSFAIPGLSSPPKKEGDATKQPMACDVVVEAVGNVSFVAAEPNTGERMLNKKLDVTSAKTTIPDQESDFCEHRHDVSKWSVKVRNAWNLAHEMVFQSSMKAVNDYMSVDEMQTFKENIKEVRSKKSY